MPFRDGTHGGNQAIPLGTPFAQTARCTAANREIKAAPLLEPYGLEENLKSRVGGDRDIHAQHETPGLSGMSDSSPALMCTGGPLIAKKQGIKT